MSEIERIRKMAETLVKQQRKVKVAEDRLKEDKKILLAMEREDLPELMKELGLKELTLETGEKISVVEDVDAAITAKNKPAALKWLTDNSFGGLIKTRVISEFDRGSHDQAVVLCEELMGRGEAVALEEKVHPATLKSFVKEQMKKGAPVPMDLFSVRSYSKIKVSNK